MPLDRLSISSGWNCGGRASVIGGWGTRASIPMGIGEYGIIWLHVTADGGAPQAISVRSGRAELAEAAIANVRTWRFAERTPTEIDVTFRYTEIPSSSTCNSDRNATVKLDLPSFVEVQSRGRRDVITSCHPTIAPIGETPPIVRSIVGRVICSSCGESPNVRDAEVVLARESGSREASTVTDSQGRFGIGLVAPGSYWLSVSTPDHRQAQGKVNVVPTSERVDPIIVDLPEPNDWIPDPGATVQAADLPSYPTDARSAGIAGESSVLALTDGARVISVRGLTGPASLIAAAMENVRTWHVSGNPSKTLVVRFRFTLLSTPCDASHTSVRLKFPNLVEVSACR